MSDQSDEPTTNTYTVPQLCSRITEVVEGVFKDEIWVQGSISGLSRSANGHVYFDLIESTEDVGQSTKAVLPVALFASSRHLVNKILRRAGGVRMHDGIEIRIRGKVTYYPPQGRVQLVMSLIDPQFTLGQMASARQALMEKLQERGLLEKNQQLAFPLLPLKVALVTSDGSAAFADFVEELESSGYPFDVVLIDSRVQGIDAVPSLTNGIRTAFDLDVDVVVVTRGGGARSDLVAFDSERVATAIARCPYPVIVGVGHEVDRSVADEVAFTSCKTPTAAAALLVDAVAQFDGRLLGAAQRLNDLTALHLNATQHRLRSSGERLRSAANRVVDRNLLMLDHTNQKLHRAPSRVIERADNQLANASVRLSALDPDAALRRGWTITRTADGQLVRSSEDVDVDSELVTRTANGTISSRVIAD